MELTDFMRILSDFSEAANERVEIGTSIERLLKRCYYMEVAQYL